MEDGRNASCCGGELVLPQIIKYGNTQYRHDHHVLFSRHNITNSTRPGGQGSLTAPPGAGTLPPPTSPPTAAPDASLCWSSCFTSSNTYHNTFLGIVEKLQAEQEANNVKVELTL